MAFSRTFPNFSIFLWCHLMWDGKLSFCFEFLNPNSFGRWKYLRCVHFSILNCTQRLFLKRFQTFPISDDVIECGMVNWASSFEFQHPIPFGRWKYLRRVHFSILNCTRRLFLGRFQTFSISDDVSECGMVNWAYVLNFIILTHLEGENICVMCILVY